MSLSKTLNPLFATGDSVTALSGTDRSSTMEPNAANGCLSS
jgi:hypothetical protein